MYNKNELYNDFFRQGRIINFKHSYNYSLKEYFHMVKIIRFCKGNYDKMIIVENDVLMIFEHNNFDMQVVNKFPNLMALTFVNWEGNCDLTNVNNTRMSSLLITGVDRIIFPKKLDNLNTISICYSKNNIIPYYPSIHHVHIGSTNILFLPDEYRNICMSVTARGSVIHNKYNGCDFWTGDEHLCNKRYNIIVNFQKIYKLKSARKKLLKIYNPYYIGGFLAKRRIECSLNN